jgi:hypothetical protein
MCPECAVKYAADADAKFDADAAKNYQKRGVLSWAVMR